MSDLVITAPFTEDQVRILNKFQHSGFFHPFTCGDEACPRNSAVDDGILVATEKGWECKCGNYTQDWAHSFMVDEYSIDTAEETLNNIKNGNYQGGN